MPIAHVRPGFDGGGNRYAIDPRRGVIYCAKFDGGLVCLDYRIGKVVWRRRDLIGIQAVEISEGFPTKVFLTSNVPDKRPWRKNAFNGVIELSAASCETLWRSNPEVIKSAPHPEKPFLILHGGHPGKVRILNEKKELIGESHMENFAVLKVAFSDQFIALAEGTKGVRLIDYEGRTLWSYRSEARAVNYTNLAFVGDKLCVQDSEDDWFFVILDVSTGAFVSEWQHECGGDVCFIEQGTKLVDWLGQIRNSHDGQCLGLFEVAPPLTVPGWQAWMNQFKSPTLDTLAQWLRDP